MVFLYKAENCLYFSDQGVLVDQEKSADEPRVLTNASPEASQANISDMASLQVVLGHLLPKQRG